MSILPKNVLVELPAFSSSIFNNSSHSTEKYSRIKFSLPNLDQSLQGFPNKVDWWGRGGNLSKMAKNCMKITKSTFLGQKSGEIWGEPIFQVVGWDPPQPPPH